MDNKILWHEGMFLMPQHFQQNDRYLESTNKNYWKLLYPDFIGIINFKVDLALLEQGEIFINECAAILPDNTIVDVPNMHATPRSLLLNNNIDEETIFLGIAKIPTDSVESSSEPSNQQLLKYDTQEIDIKDVHSITSDAISSAKLLIGTLAIRLLTESETLNYIAIPLLKVKKDIINNKFTIINEYIPPCINAYASPYLTHELLLLEKLLNYRITSISDRVKENNLTQSDKLLEIQYLRILINFSSMIIAFNFKKHIYPKELYFYLFAFTRELAIFSDIENLHTIKPGFCNKNLFVCFSILINKIKEYLTHTSNPKIITIKGENLEKGLWKFTNIPSELLFEANFYLGISLKNHTEEQNFSFQQHLKIAPLEEIKNLVYRSLPGIDATPPPKLPREIPYHHNFIYFQLNQSNELWNKVENSTGLGIYLSGKFEPAHLQLWMVKKT